eukprot:maker-scaffold514_size150699-snap-gene-0.26 protein:Tk01730 transcript:maker-scaffold514_size150699-snap-gene-0.26-mRNA-1 annotation:"GG14552"
MARHRDVRNLDAEDFGEDDYDYASSYGSSYMDETSLSTSVERDYMYRRGATAATGATGATGHTPKMGHFFARRSDSIGSVPEEDEAEGGPPPSASALGRGRARSDSETSSNQEDEDDAGEPLSPEAVRQLAQCLEQILDVVGDSIPEASIREAVLRYDFDTEVALNTLLNNPNLGRSAGTRAQAPVAPARPEGLEGPSTPASGLKLPPAMRKAQVDGLERYAQERGRGRSQLNLVVVGHVDSGKSTLMGHLLLDLGQVSRKLMHKYEQESKKIGKQSFAFAWVLDECSEERERGITIDVGQSQFATPTKLVTLLDAPGHKDFIPNMISGAYQADVSILVVNGTRGEFEAGFEMGGQTREHALLVRSLGVAQLIVAVNKLDTVEWDRGRFTEIRTKLGQFLKLVGFKEADVTYVPCSGFTGDNLTQPSGHLGAWYAGPTLLAAIDGFRPPTRLVDQPFRMFISDIYKGQSSGICCAGRIEAGFVLKEDKVLILPLQEVATVKGIIQGDMPTTAAYAGDHCALVLSGPDMASLATGMVLSDPQDPIPMTKRFEARIVIFNIDLPITKGYTAVLHYGSVQVQAVIKKLLAVIDKSNGSVVKSKPRCLVRNCNAIVEIVLDSPICMEEYAKIKELGRFMLRNGGKTIAAGLVNHIK